MSIGKIRIGIGHDTHRFHGDEEMERIAMEARNAGKDFTPALRIGGVSIPYERTLKGHSDADVLLHAVADAVLGAAGLDDIGEHFPDTSEENRGRDSAEILRISWELAAAKGWRIANLDTIVFAQTPKMSPFKRQIQSRIAGILGIEPDQVGVKAKTGEGIGIIGRRGDFRRSGGTSGEVAFLGRGADEAGLG